MTTPHFIGLRRGFQSTLYVERFEPFTPADFAWHLTDTFRDIGGRGRIFCLTAGLTGTPSAAVAAHLAVFATAATKTADSWRAFARGWAELPKLKASEYLRVACNYAGCPNKQTKAARDDKAEAEMLALRATRPALEQKACDAFNKRIADVIEEANTEYLRVWHGAVVSGSHRDAWVLASGREVEVAAYKDLAEREAQLAEAVRLARSQLSALRDEQHVAYQALVFVRLADEGWTDNDKVPFPAELREHIEKTLTKGRREQGPFHD